MPEKLAEKVSTMIKSVLKYECSQKTTLYTNVLLFSQSAVARSVFMALSDFVNKVKTLALNQLSDLS